MTELDQTIRDQATAPHKVTVDGLTSEGHSLKELVEADRYLRSRDASNRSAFRRLNITKLIPPGSE